MLSTSWCEHKRFSSIASWKKCGIASFVPTGRAVVSPTSSTYKPPDFFMSPCSVGVGAAAGAVDYTELELPFDSIHNGVMSIQRLFSQKITGCYAVTK